MKYKSDVFLDLIYENILPRIDFEALQKSYETADRSYAKGILNHLHAAMVKAYGSDTLYPTYEVEDNFVVVPGVVQGRKTGKISLALLEIDLSSCGKHLKTHFLSNYGVISQERGRQPGALYKSVVKPLVPYDYCYTAKIPDGIHINYTNLLIGLKDMLNTFHEHTAELSPLPS